MGSTGATPILVLCLFTVVVISTVNAQGRCAAHCDSDGYYQRAFYCSSPGEEYCCGTLTNRYCCGNSTMDITGKYDDQYVCERTSWWLYHWQIIIGLLGTIIVLLLVAACCCQCCGACKRQRARLTGRTLDDPEVNTVSGGVDGDTDAQRMQTFDPNHPFAFQPPDYDSLPKEPPKYEEIYEEGGGVSNPAFSGEPSANSSPSGENAPGPSQVHSICLRGADAPGPSGTSPEISPRTPRSIQFTTHGASPSLGELPSYEVAILEPSTSTTVNYSARREQTQGNTEQTSVTPNTSPPVYTPNETNSNQRGSTETTRAAP